MTDSGELSDSAQAIALIVAAGLGSAVLAVELERTVRGVPVDGLVGALFAPGADVEAERADAGLVLVDRARADPAAFVEDVLVVVHRLALVAGCMAMFAAEMDGSDGPTLTELAIRVAWGNES